MGWRNTTPLYFPLDFIVPKFSSKLSSDIDFLLFEFYTSLKQGGGNEMFLPYFSLDFIVPDYPANHSWSRETRPLLLTRHTMLTMHPTSGARYI